MKTREELDEAAAHFAAVNGDTLYDPFGTHDSELFYEFLSAGCLLGGRIELPQFIVVNLETGIARY